MKMKSSILGILAVSLCLAFLPTVVFADAKTDIQETLDELVEAAESNKGDENKVPRRAAMRKIIEPRFDFEEMAKRSLGSHWKKRTEAERESFISVFSELLASTYLSKIDMIERGMVSVGEQKKRENKAFVKTTVDYKGDKFGIDYKLINRDGKWRVYDVIIENIGLVANYRNEFSGIIRKEKFAGLLSRLEAKVKKKSEADS